MKSPHSETLAGQVQETAQRVREQLAIALHGTGYRHYLADVPPNKAGDQVHAALRAMLPGDTPGQWAFDPALQPWDFGLSTASLLLGKAHTASLNGRHSVALDWLRAAEFLITAAARAHKDACLEEAYA